MRRLWIILFAVALVPRAIADNTQTFKGPLTRVQCGGNLVGTRATINFPANASCLDDPNNSRVNVTPAAGSGGTGANGLLGVDTCMPIDGNVSPMFTNAGSCLDPTEANVLQRVGIAATFNNLACKSSASTGGGQTVAMKVRVQTGCTGAAVDSALTCTILAASNACTGTTSVAVSAGDCIDVSVAPSGALTTPLAVNCTVERTA